MKFSDLYSQKDVVYSFEYFPPKDPENISRTLNLIERMSQLHPDYMTVTYGAGGSTTGLTREITHYIVGELKVPSVAHLTCVGHSRSEIDKVLDSFHASGITNILALRGDPPKGQGKFVPHPEGFSCARDLAAHIHTRGDFSLAVAGYPEGHPEATSEQEELDYLKQKVESGGEIVLTQLFFENDLFLNFAEQARAAGITVPIVPGILPVASLTQLERISALCGATIPQELYTKLESYGDDKESLRAYGTEFALNQCRILLENGAPGIHFYTLNKSRQVEEIMSELKE